MDFHVSLTERGDLAARIYRQLLDAVVDGRLRPGERLPPSRELARQLAVSRNTVAVAYERLAAEGYLVGRVGAGTFVAAAAVDQSAPRQAPQGAGVRPRAVWRAMPEPPTPPAAAPEYDFRAGIPDARLFPYQVWRRLVAAELRPGAVASAGYGDPAGHAGLRGALARHLGMARAVRASAEDVLVTQGAQQALDLVGRVLLEPGYCVAVEDPGYPPARQLFGSMGARVVGVPVDSEGIDVATIPDDARMVYVTPSHQYPLGMPMSLRRRAALLAWAERRGAVVVEDDYDSEFRFGDRPLDPLQSLDRSGRVVYVGSLSKTLLPMLRIGFLIAPASLRSALRRAKQLTDWHGDPTVQAALARFIDDGLLSRHVRRAARAYADRHERITAALRRDFGGLLEVVPSAAGLHLCARRAPGAEVDLEAAVVRAAEAGVAVTSLARYHDGVVEAGLVIGYGGIPSEKITEGMRRLAAAVWAARPRPSAE